MSKFKRYADISGEYDPRIFDQARRLAEDLWNNEFDYDYNTDKWYHWALERIADALTYASLNPTVSTPPNDSSWYLLPGHGEMGQ